MHFSFTTILLAAAALIETSQAIRAVQGSPCEAKCGDITNTTASDIVCTDADYGTPTGQVFAECITCQLNSTALDPETGESDLKWLLYNLRYAMSTCLWGIPSNKYIQNTPCITSRACGPFEDNIIHESLSANTTTYSYCHALPEPDFTDRCIECLHGLGSNVYLSNFFTTSTSACTDLSRSKLTLSGSLFGTEYISVVEEIEPVVDKSGVEDEGPLSLGTKIGVAIGGICVFLLLAGLILLICGKRRQRRMAEIQRKRNQEIWAAAGISSPVSAKRPKLDTKWPVSASQRSLTHVSPQSPLGGFETWSPYHSQYSSPISARAVPVEKAYSLYNSPVSARAVPAEKAPAGWDWPNRSPVSGETIREDRAEKGEMGGTVEMGRVRPMGKRERDEADRRLAEEWAREVAAKGFTVSVPPKKGGDMGGGLAVNMFFPPPPTKAKK